MSALYRDRYGYYLQQPEGDVLCFKNATLSGGTAVLHDTSYAQTLPVTALPARWADLTQELIDKEQE